MQRNDLSSLVKLPSLPVLLALGLVVAPGCANKQKSETETPGAIEGGGGEQGPDSAARPSRAASSDGSTRLSSAGGRIKSFETPKEPRTEMVLALPVQPGAELSVTEVRPSMASPGSQVEIFGTGFLEAAGDNKVSSGGADWTVVEVYGDRLVAVVPEGAGGGAVNVQAGAGKGATTNAFAPLGGDDAFEQPSTDLNGLVGTVYKLGEKTRELSKGLAELEAVGTIGLNSLAIASSPSSDFEMGLDAYGISFVGSLNVAEGGEYDLCLTAEDQGQLSLMGTVVVMVEGTTEACELVYLEAGEYDLQIDYVNVADTPNGGLTFSWAKDGGGKSPVPSSALFRP